MLTPRGFWFFLITCTLLALALLLGAGQLTLLCATLLIWFLSQWFLFQLRLRMGIRRLTLTRSLGTARGDVTSLWAGQSAEVAVTVSSTSWLALPYLIVTDRMAPLARHKHGTLCVDGAIGADRPLTIAYTIECKSAGWLRFEGVKIQFADLQGFFAVTTFLHDLREYSVMPAMSVKASHTSFVKQHNILPLVGTHRHARPGGSSELLDLRDYLPGDPPKMIAWKLSARRDRLITKEFESEVDRKSTRLKTSHASEYG